jgi:ammonia channel protein AmtB
MWFMVFHAGLVSGCDFCSMSIEPGMIPIENTNQDFAGSGVVHLTGGISGLVGTTILGARTERVPTQRSSSATTCHWLFWGPLLFGSVGSSDLLNMF